MLVKIHERSKLAHWYEYGQFATSVVNRVQVYGFGGAGATGRIDAEDQSKGLGGIAAFSMGRAAPAATPEEVSVAGDDGGVVLTRYAADQAGQRAGVVILHGSRGIELKPRAYQRHADALNANGIDAYLTRYFTAWRSTCRLVFPIRRIFCDDILRDLVHLQG
jgi:hypothetical protein